MRVDAAMAGGLDELVVAELVGVVLVEHRVRGVDDPGDRLDVRPSHEGVRRVATFEDARVVEVVRADDSDAGLEERARCGEPAGVEVEVVSGEERERLDRLVVAVVDLAWVARPTRRSHQDVRVGSIQGSELCRVVAGGDKEEPVGLGRGCRDALDEGPHQVGSAQHWDDDDDRLDHRVSVTLRFLRL